MGASVTSTVRGKIFNAELYEDEPEIVMLGMFTSLMTASIMMLVATYFGLPVSTTHTVIGCIIGFTVSAKGFESVNWNETKNIFISWVASPVLTGLVAFIIFAVIRSFILLSANPFTRGYCKRKAILDCYEIHATPTNYFFSPLRHFLNHTHDHPCDQCLLYIFQGYEKLH